MKRIICFLITLWLIAACQQDQNKKSMFITEKTKRKAIENLVTDKGENLRNRIETGVNQAAFFWEEVDGTRNEFIQFCSEYFIAEERQRDTLFEKISRNIEVLYGNHTKMGLELREPLDLDRGSITPVDMLFGSYNPASHLSDDLFKNKIYFHILLNFPSYSLNEKLEKGNSWSRQEWAYAAMGDIVDSREPSALLQQLSDAATEAETYISEYNIHMGILVNENMEKLFPADKVLISHWGLRDDLKSYYNTENGLEQQRMIYALMNHIINQDIPVEVINSDRYLWNPMQNKMFDGAKEMQAKREPDTRYLHVLNYAKLFRQQDAYYPKYPTVISRAFEMETQIPRETVEDLFKKLLISDEVRQTAKLISKRLNRELEPFDIWYNGFRSANTMAEDELDRITTSKYPSPADLKKDLPVILQKLGFEKDKAEYLVSKIAVDPARGSGHAAGAAMRGDVAHLRTRFTGKGMNYKGYNIAVHEFGHNVEQTISLYDVDHYLLNGVPNTAFTEALAFLFQERDLELLGVDVPGKENEYLSVLDILWSSYEIMGVALVDNAMWAWLYENPDATPAGLRDAVTRISKEIWNTYYADVFGVKDQVILGIYSHMISYPLYLHAYPLGHIIQFQLRDYLKGKNFGTEVERIFALGSITPDAWMMKAVGQPLSVDPLLKASVESLHFFTEEL
ncbi:MAG: hypothetical protein JXR41_14135 [Bacteroidales bacterium]|nr:hypothetical protein [Bacteroidales bacterium]MBN2764228.1 hypothetical protein [Bacteroidales bacterium]